jgi:hypothetical protein
MYALMYSSGEYSTMPSPTKEVSAMGWSEGCLCIDAASEQSEYADCSSNEDCQLEAFEPQRWMSLFVLHREVERCMGEVMEEDGLRAMAPKFDMDCGMSEGYVDT